MSAARTGQASVRNYAVVTLAYWADTLADGAIRTLVLFYFYNLGYSAWQVASLFLLYEFFGIVTNLLGGYLGARFGLKATLFLGLGTQLIALAMLGGMPAAGLTVVWVMASQALSGIAKDMTKMSSKSAVKMVAGDGAGWLYKWVAVLTGSKNALKGVGFFLGGLLLSLIGFQASVWALFGVVAVAMVVAALLMKGGLGTTNKKVRFSHLFSNQRSINLLSLARLFLFGARDVWFVVALPVFLRGVLGWPFWQAGGFLALWVIGYGIVQASAPALMKGRAASPAGSGPDGRTALWLALVLAVIPATIALALQLGGEGAAVIVSGLVVFGIIFALNSAVHSYLILAYADQDRVAMNVGIYYMANAGGRLAGTVLSGALYEIGLRQGERGGMILCLLASSALVVGAVALSMGLPRHARLKVAAS